MNLVTELLRLAPGASEGDAVARLSTLFEMMSRAKGFRDAEVLRRTDDPGRLMVLHTWDEIEDWHAFQTSDTKLAFSASRPAFLYNFEPCGINWLLQAGGESLAEAPFVHRQLIKQPLAPLFGPDIVASQTFSYQDYEPSLEGAMLRLTRSNSLPGDAKLPGDCVLADELYESVHRLVSARNEKFEFAG